MATMIRVSRKVIDKITAVRTEHCYLRVAHKGDFAIITFGATSEAEMVEVSRKVAANEVGIFTSNFLLSELKVACEDFALDVPISIDESSFTIGSLTLSEVEAPAMFYGHDQLKAEAKNIYSGPAIEITEEAAGIIGKSDCELFDGSVQVRTCAKGNIIIGTNGLVIIRERTESAEVSSESEEGIEGTLSAEFPEEPNAPTLVKEPEDMEIPFEEEPVKEPPKKEENMKVVKLEEGEIAAFLVSPKTFGAVLENIQSVVSGAKLSIFGKGSMIAMQAYKEPVQIKFLANANAVVGDLPVFTVDLDKITLLTKSLCGIEDEVRFSLGETRLKIVGSETNLSVPLVTPGTMLSEKPEDGVAVAMYPKSLSAALRASVCFAKEKDENGFDNLLFSITEDGNNVSVYSSDKYNVSRARVKGRAVKTDDCRFIVPSVIRSIKWPEGDEPVQFNFGSGCMGITINDGRQYIIRYKSEKYTNIIPFFKGLDSVKTKVTVRGEEVKQRLGLIVAGDETPNKKKAAILEIDNGITASLGNGSMIIGTYGKTTGPALRIGFDAKYLLRNVGAFATDENLFICFTSANEGFYLMNKDGSLVIAQLPCSLGK